METKNVAQMLVEELVISGVKRIYGLIGDSLNPIGNAVRVNKKLEWVHVRHEETAAYAAGSEASLTGELCVCAATAGPGSIHLINGLYEANRNHSPVLALVTDYDSSEDGLSYFQATHPQQLYKDCSIFCETLSNVALMPRLLQEAMQTSLNNKGVAVLIIPKNIAESIVEDSVYSRIITENKHHIKPNVEDVTKMANLLNAHKNITLYCGIGCKEAKTEVLYLANLLKAPTVSTIRSKDFMENENPNNAGMNGMISSWESKKALDNCDLLVLLGTDFPFQQFIPTHPIIIQVDIAGKHLGRRSKLDLGIIGDIKSTLDMLNPMIKAKDDEQHLNQSLDYKENIDKKKQEELDKMSKMKVLRPEYLTHILSKVANDDSIFVVDVGLNDIWAARYVDSMPQRDIIGSFKHGTMAAAVPEAIGAKKAFPDRQVIAMAGDGGLTMLLGELLTIVQNKIPVKIVVYNNGELGFIRLESNMEKIPPFEISLQNPDFAELAKVIGIKAIKIDSPNNLENILREALANDEAVLINAVTDPTATGY